MNIEIADQHFTNKPDRESTILVAMRGATQPEVADAAECVALVCLMLSDDLDSEMRKAAIEALRVLVVRVDRAAWGVRQSRKTAQEPTADDRFVCRDGSEGDAM